VCREGRPSIDQVAAAVLDHLSAFPNASDTAEGIARFWMPRPLAGAPPEIVRATLDRLVAQGALVAIPVAGGAVRFAAPARTRGRN
jgi:hypothetical protein